MANRLPLHVISRMEFKADHFPQTLCAGCSHLRTCQELLAEARPDEFWLVRDGGECARAFPQANPPPDVAALRGRLVALLRQHDPR